MARTKGALDRANPEFIKQQEEKKEALKKKYEADIAAIDEKIKAAQEKRIAKLAAKLVKSGKTEKEIDDFLSNN